METLTRDFFERDTVTVARELLGKCLIRPMGLSDPLLDHATDWARLSAP